jgi:hypothetical protein
MAAEKVRCATCVNQSGGFCIKKKTSVKLNKWRRCDEYKIDSNKVKIRNPVTVTRVLHQAVVKDLKDEYKKSLKEEEMKKVLERSTSYIDSADNKYPLTGDLSRFISSVSEE